MGVIYQLYSDSDFKFYIGSSVDLSNRISQHKYQSRYLDSPLCKYIQSVGGWENILIAILEDNIDDSVLKERELFWVNMALQNKECLNSYVPLKK